MLSSESQQTPLDAFNAQIKAKADALGKHPIVFVGLEAPSDDDDDEYEPTAQDCAKIKYGFLSQADLERFDNLAKQMRKTSIGGFGGDDEEEEDEDDDFGMMFTNTGSSYHGQEVLATALKQAEKELAANKFHDALVSAVSAAMIGKDFDYWFSDTDAPEEVEKILKKFKSVFKKLFEKTDEQLGIDAETRVGAIAGVNSLGELVKETGFYSTKLKI